MPDTDWALVKRLNRKLAHEGEHLHRTRGSAYSSDLGEWYIVNQANFVVAGHLDPTALARELHVREE